MNSEEFCRKFEQLQAVYTDIIEKNKTIEEQGAKIKELEQTISKSGYKIVPDSNCCFTLVKDETAVVPEGDYLNPVQYQKGMEVTKGLWYTDGASIWEAVKNGVPSGFDDKNYFDIIEV